MKTPNIGTRDDWLEARTKLLDLEKDLNRQRDELAKPYQAINTTALRTSRRAIHPKPNDDIVARDGVATNHAAIETSAYSRLNGNTYPG